MVPFRALTDQEARAIFSYLRSIPAIHNRVPRPAGRAQTAGDGRQVYYAYGCSGCHGDSGRGQWDLRQGPVRFPTDAELIAFLKHPERVEPGIAMPTWDGVIGENEYTPLAAYVRSLARRDDAERPGEAR
jgi:mono/diheme cytochrome c family protein